MITYIVAGIVVAVCVIVGFGATFTDPPDKDKSIPHKLALGAGRAIGGIWSVISWVLIISAIIWFVLNGGLEPAP